MLNPAPICLLALALTIAAGLARADEAIRYNYMLHCQGCHLADGTGHEPAVPSLVNRLGRMLAVPDGRAFMVQVPGTSQAPLSDQEVADLLNWLLENFNRDSLAEGFVPYTSDEIASLRVQSSGNIAERREQIIAAMEE